jgi:hypothetical protein
MHHGQGVVQADHPVGGDLGGVGLIDHHHLKVDIRPTIRGTREGPDKHHALDPPIVC